MAKTRAFTYNTSVVPIGLTQIGNIHVSGVGESGLTSSTKWWNGPDENLGYIICGENQASNQPTSEGGTASLQFWRSSLSTTQSFISLSEFITRRHGSPQQFVFATQASTWLNNNGYWTSYIPEQPWSLLEEISEYLRNYMSDFRNPSFYNYQLDGDGTYISDGGGDMYDSGNFTSPWLLSGTQYTSNSGNSISFPFRINYQNTTETIVDTDFYYTSLGYQQFNLGSQSTTLHPLTVIGSRKEIGPVGWQVGGNSGADGGGTLASGLIWNGTQSNGFETYAFYRQTYNAGDPSHCNLVILLGHTNWGSEFGPTFSFAHPVSPDSCGMYFYTATASSILAIHTLLSKSGGQQVTAVECQNVVNKFTLRIKEALGY